MSRKKTPGGAGKGTTTCSFCGRPEGESGPLFSGRPLADQVGAVTPFICLSCVEHCLDIAVGRVESGENGPVMTPGGGL